MRKSVIGIYNNGNFIQGIPYIYDGTQWKHARPNIYEAGWLEIGGAGTLFDPLLERYGDNYNSTEKILVRRSDEINRFMTSDNKVFHVKSVVPIDPSGLLSGVPDDPVNMRLIVTN